MGRTITLEVNQKEYVLEFNRRTLLLASDIEKMMKEKDNLAEQYETYCKFVRTAFLKNHPNISQEEVNDIVDSIDDLQGFMKALTQIIDDSVNVVKEKKGNAHWEVN